MHTPGIMGAPNGEGVRAAWATHTPERKLEIKQATGEAVSAGWAARSHLPAIPAQTAQVIAASAENAARVAAGREGLEADVLGDASGHMLCQGQVEHQGSSCSTPTAGRGHDPSMLLPPDEVRRCTSHPIGP